MVALIELWSMATETKVFKLFPLEWKEEKRHQQRFDVMENLLQNENFSVEVISKPRRSKKNMFIYCKQRAHSTKVNDDVVACASQKVTAKWMHCKWNETKRKIILERLIWTRAKQWVHRGKGN